IKNLTIAPPGVASGSYLGLFASLGDGAVVKNIRMEYSSTGINTLYLGYFGGIAGYCTGTIMNCSVKGSISGGSTSNVGGIVGKLVTGRVTGCAFRGSLTAYMVGGITGFTDSSYINMCYADMTVDGTAGGGLTGPYLSHGDGLTRDTVLNSYTYMGTIPSYMKVYSLFHVTTAAPTFIPYFYSKCYSNNGIVQANTNTYSTIADLNTQLATITTVLLPTGIIAPPGKPFKTSSDAKQSPLLWWE
ncbi:MAG: hypothetical protein JST39_06445, partial [Bacteroidetes bacterium]|nr:hypothetical protein [Bacteroidota bacterium]